MRGPGSRPAPRARSLSWFGRLGLGDWGSLEFVVKQLGDGSACGVKHCVGMVQRVWKV